MGQVRYTSFSKSGSLACKDRNLKFRDYFRAGRSEIGNAMRGAGLECLTLVIRMSLQVAAMLCLLVRSVQGRLGR